MAKDLVIFGTEYENAAGIIVKDDSGNDVTCAISNGTWNWMGKNPTRVKDYGVTKTYFDKTSLATWTPSTTETAIVSSVSLESYVPDFSNYDYIVTHKFHSHFVYQPNTEGARAKDIYWIVSAFSSGYHSSLSGITNDTTTQTSSSYIQAFGGLFYYNESDQDAYVQNASYGVYPSYASPTINSSTISPKIPSISARCYSTYHSVEAARFVEPDASYYEVHVEIWRVDRFTGPYGAQRGKEIRDMWLNGI